MDSKEIKPVNPKGNQSWVFIGRTDAEAETPILWPSHVKSQFTGKDPDPGPWKESYDQPRQHIKNQRHYFANKGPSDQGYGFSSGHVWMSELDYKEI